MADNVAITAGTGTTVAADEVVDATLGTVKVQFVKIMDGTLDGTSKATVGSNGLKTDGSGVTQPISASTLPLPTGASTAAKQPALGTAGTASADVLTIQGITSMTAIKTDGSATTQPISGTVTANAGTNLNTSLLALESGGNLASIKTDADNLNLAQGSTTSGQKGNLTLGAVTTAAPTYTTAQSNPLSLTTSGLLRVDGSGATQPVSVAGTLPVNMTQINGVASSVGNGTTDTGTQRVTLSSDSTGQVKLATGANTIGAVSNTSFAVTQATAASLNATVVGTGTFAVQAAGGTASGSSLTASPLTGGGLAKTANPTAVSDGQVVNSTHDKLGKQVVVGSIRDLKADAALTLTSTTTETTLIAQIASTFIDVYGLIVANISATACEVIFRDTTAGTARFSIEVPAGDTRGFMLPESAAYKQTTVNTNWTAQCGTSVASIKINALYVKNI